MANFNGRFEEIKLPVFMVEKSVSFAKQPRPASAKGGAPSRAETPTRVRKGIAPKRPPNPAARSPGAGSGFVAVRNSTRV